MKYWTVLLREIASKLIPQYNGILRLVGILGVTEGQGRGERVC